MIQRVKKLITKRVIMKNALRHFLIIAITALLAFTFIACDNPSGSSMQNPSGTPYIPSMPPQAPPDTPPDITIGALPVELVRVPGGTFELGRELGTQGAGNVTPVSTVALSGFFIGRYPITQGQFMAVMGRNPSHFSGNPAAEETQGRRPVEMISWFDAIVFSNRLSIMRGLTPAYMIAGTTDPDTWGPVPTSWNEVWNAVQIIPGSTGYRLPTEASGSLRRKAALKEGPLHFPEATILTQ